MIFRIFGKVQNCAKTIVRPNGPKLSLSAGHHPTTLQEHDKYGREFSIRNAHMIRIVFVSACGVRRQGMGSTKD